MLDLFAQNFGAAPQPKSQHIRDLNLELVLSPQEADQGGHLTLGVPLFKPCRVCEGSGITGFHTCDECEGRGIDELTAQVDVLFSPHTPDGTVIPVSLRHLGIRNMNLQVHVRVSA